MKTSVTLGDGQKISLLDTGSGPTVVFVHGLPGQASDFEPTIEALAPGARCLAYDRTGYGSSLPIQPERHATIAANVATLRDLLDHLDIATATLVGWSFGGHIAMAAAAAMPDRVERLVLVGSAGPTFPWPNGFADRLLFHSRLGPALFRLLQRFGSRVISSILDDAYGARAPRLLHDQFSELLSPPKTVERWIEEGRLWNPADCPAGEVHQPTLVVHGMADTRVPVKVARDNASLIADARSELLPEVGHWPCHSHASTMARLISDFVAQRPVEAAA